MDFSVRELSPIETHDLRRRVSAAGRISLPSWDHELDEAPGSWHLGAVDSQGKVVAVATFFQLPCPYQPEVAGAYRLQFMAVEPALQRAGLGTLVLTEGLERLRSSNVPLLWATSRPEAVPFYERFGFSVAPGSESDAEASQPTVLLDLTL
jgi:predicted N-acetyltransferase YhbS